MLYTFRVSLRATGEFEVKLALRRALFKPHFIRVSFPVSLFYRVSFSIMGQRPSEMENATGFGMSSSGLVSITSPVRVLHPGGEAACEKSPASTALGSPAALQIST